jgi:hypothetical protein
MICEEVINFILLCLYEASWVYLFIYLTALLGPQFVISNEGVFSKQGTG